MNSRIKHHLQGNDILNWNNNSGEFLPGFHTGDEKYIYMISLFFRLNDVDYKVNEL